jgi:hypothetical protein
MFAAAIGLLGVLLGAVLSYGLSAIATRRRALGDALVEMFALSTRVTIAHDRLDGLAENSMPSGASNEFAGALTERDEAFMQWQIALARLELLIREPCELWGPIYDFHHYSASARAQISLNLRLGVEFPAGEREGALTELHKAQYTMFEMGRSLLFSEKVRKVIPNPRIALRNRRARRQTRALSAGIGP